MLSELELGGLICGAVAAMAGGAVQGCAGFGLGLTVAPCLMLVLTPAVAVPVVLTLSIVNSFLVTIHARRHLHRPTLFLLLIGGAVGTPIGIQILRLADGNLIKLIAGVLVILVSGAMIAGWSRPLRHPHRALIPVGFFSGILGGSTSMGGPPIVLFLSNQDTPKENFRASLISYFFFVSCLTVGLQAAVGMYTPQVALQSAVFIPPLLVGTYCGVAMARRVPEKAFQRAVLIGVACMGVVLLISSLRVLLFS